MAKPLMISAKRRYPASSWSPGGRAPPGMVSAETTPIPTRPSAATASPMTEPPSKAMRSARAWPLLRAASEVRTLALVAAFMPKSPARMEQPPPKT